MTNSMLRGWTAHLVLLGCLAMSLIPYPESRLERLASYVAVSLLICLGFAAGKVTSRPWIGPITAVVAALFAALLTVLLRVPDANPRMMGFVFLGLFFVTSSASWRAGKGHSSVRLDD